MNKLINYLKNLSNVLIDYSRLISNSRLISEQNKFILYELRRINESLRHQMLPKDCLPVDDTLQTQSSFDYQWHELPTGIAMPDDKKFMKDICSLLYQMTDLPKEWFSEKSIIDIGCGAGRFTYGFLSSGASVLACDQSSWALERTAKLCDKFTNRLTTKKINLLTWDEKAEFDLSFCYGVAHHTGNTYLAIRNAAIKVKPGGKLFLMIYGFPETLSDFIELNSYEQLRDELRNLSLEEKEKVLIERFGSHNAHGWFDAVSPRINDLLTYQEIVELLLRLGFRNIKRTLKNRNHHIIAYKPNN